MCRFMSAAVRASTSSKSSEELTSSPISASVLRTSAEISAFSVAVVRVAGASVWSFGGFMNSYHNSRQPRRVRESSLWQASLVCSRYAEEGLEQTLRLRTAARSIGRFSSFVLRLQAKYSDSLEIAVTLRIVQAKADHEFVRDAKSDVIRLHSCNPPFRLIQQHRDAQPLRLALFKYAQEILQRHPRIQNIFHHNDRPALDTGIQILCKSYLAGGFRVLAVTRHCDEIKRHLARNSPGEIREKKHRTFQNADQ